MRRPPALELIRARSLAEYHAQAKQLGAAWQQHLALLAELEARLPRHDRYRAWSWPAGRQVNFLIEGPKPVNWRETLRCPKTGLASRMRASLHLFEQECRPRKDAAIYLMEHDSPVYRLLRQRWPSLVGSEFLGDAFESGAMVNGRRHEDATRLSFASDSLDCVLSFDVFEHVPDYRAALAESCRVLRREGCLLLSVPFDIGSQANLVRASHDSAGKLVHHVTPQYHGNPLSKEGILSYYTFGWELLEDARAAGFSDAEAVLFWSEDYGYLGPAQVFFIARK